jgi:hypothetical protein
MDRNPRIAPRLAVADAWQQPTIDTGRYQCAGETGKE